MRTQTQQVVHAVVWGATALFLIALALRDLQLDRTIVAEAKLDRATPYLSTLGPPSRVALSSQSSDGTASDRAALRAEPVYINLRIPRWFRRATVELQYENPHNLPFRFGVRTHPTQWAFQFPEALSCPTPGVGQPDCFRFLFVLDRAWQVERNVYRFVLSVPGVSREQPLIVHSLRVIAEREPVCVGRICI